MFFLLKKLKHALVEKYLPLGLKKVLKIIVAKLF